MKHVELVTELLLSIDCGEPLHKKAKLNQVIKGGAVSPGDLNIAGAHLKTAVNVTFQVLPDLKTTRFRQLADFYSLVLLFHELRSEGLAVSLHDSRRNALAGSLLRSFGLDVDRASENISKGVGVTESEKPFHAYLTTVKEGTDSKTQRKRRDQILREVLNGVFEPLDTQRAFNPTQRRILWHSSNKICPKCRKPIKRWEDIDIDHVTAYIKGGKTKLNNAALVCRPCNRKKAAK
jgi:5-methylcytosine-specific restriction endonuclease McrA